MFPLQIWKQPHRIKCSDKFRVNKQDTDCFEHLHEENTKLSVNVTALYVWIFLSTSGFLWFLQRGEKEWQDSNRIGLGCWCFFVVKLGPAEAAIQWWYEKYTRNETKNIYVGVTQFLVYSLFRTWTSIKTEFLRI